MRTQFFVGVVVAAFAHEVKIKLAEEIGKGISVKGFDGSAVAGVKPNAVGIRSGRALMRIW